MSQRSLLPDSPASTPLLAAAAASLIDHHSGWAARAHAELVRRGARVGAEGARCAARLAALSSKADALEAASTAINARLARSMALADNLNARCSLLGELGASAPADGDASRAFAATLSSWGEQARALRGRVGQLAERAKAAAAAQEEDAWARAVGRRGAPPSLDRLLPQHELRRLQEAMAGSARELSEGMGAVRALRVAVAAREEGE